MGAPIARRLAEAGHAVTVWNRTRAKAEGLGGARCELARRSGAGSREAAEGAGADVPLARTTRTQMGRAIDLGHGDEDMVAIYYASRPGEKA